MCWLVYVVCFALCFEFGFIVSGCCTLCISGGFVVLGWWFVWVGGVLICYCLITSCRLALVVDSCFGCFVACVCCGLGCFCFVGVCLRFWVWVCFRWFGVVIVFAGFTLWVGVVCQVALASVLVTLAVCWLWLVVIVFVNGCLIVLLLWFFIEVFSWLFGICLFNFFMFGWYGLNWLGLAWVFLGTWFCILFLALVLCWALVPGFVGADVCGFL